MRSVSSSSPGVVKSWIRSLLMGLSAVFLAVGGVFGVTATVASATTSAFTLSMTSGSFAAHGNAPTALPTPASITGHVNSTTGNITAATLSIPAWHENNTGSSETIQLFEPSPGSGTGTIDYLGDMSYSDTLSILVHITSPITERCTSTPVHVALTSSSPYNTGTHIVTLSQTNYSIPNFSSSTCALAASTLNSKFSGSSGNSLSLTLHGTLPEPPPPAATSVTVLSTTPASPQVKGTSVTLKATIKKTTGALATTATGTVQFKNGTTVLTTATVTAGVGTFTTSALPVGTNHLSAAYSGNGSYKSSTSTTTTYTITPAPTVAVTGLPSTITGGTATPHTFTMTITNPGSGLGYTHLFLNMKLSGMRGLPSTKVKLQYQDSLGTWCSFLGFTGSGTNIHGSFAGVGSTCTPTFPASFSLAAGASLTVNLRVSYPTTGFYGNQKFTATLSTGTCTSATACTAVTPLTGTASPVGTASVEVVPTSPIASKLIDFATRLATSTVHKTFNVGLESQAAPVTAGAGLSAPTGTVSYTVDGSPVTTSALLATTAANSRTNLYLYNTSGLSVGKHTLVSTYSGDQVYSGSTLTETFTVIAAPTGTAFNCTITGLAAPVTVPAYVTATGTVPANEIAGATAHVTGITVTAEIDPVVDATLYNTTPSVAQLGFSPNGTFATSGPITFTGTTHGPSAVTGTWTGVSTTVTIPGTATPGSKVSVGSDLIAFRGGADGWDCTPASSPAPIGTITVASASWSLSGCTSGSTMVPNGAAYMWIVANGAGGGGGGAAASATGYGGTGGAGGQVTTKVAVTSGSTISAKTGCGGNGAPQGGGVVGNGGAAVSGWSSSGAGGQGTYCATFFSSCGHNDGTGGSGGGSTGVCNGASTCTSATTAHVVAVAGGGGGGGESMCAGTTAGGGGQSGNSTTKSTSSSKGKGLSGSSGGTGGTGGASGGAGGANDKSSGSGSATGATGGHGSSSNWEGDSAGSGGGGGGYVGGAGGANSGADADCGAGGGGGGGSSWVATAGTTTSFGTGAAGGSHSGSAGTAGSVTVTFLP